MVSYKFTMPWPPSVNGYWRTFRNRQIISKRGRHYRDCAIEKLEKLNLCGEGVSSRLKVSLVLNPPTLRKYDVDNFCKGLFDAISKSGFWLDDEQIDLLVIRKGHKVKGGNVEVVIDEI